MTNLLWSLVAKVVSNPLVSDWLIKRAKRTPYSHILSDDGKEVYMERYWLFNPYPSKSMGKRKLWQFPISIRLHCIRQPDHDRDHHDHPWNARTIILRGSYLEERDEGIYVRRAGTSAAIKFNQFHRIAHVFPEPAYSGVWTMFITGKYRGKWGFNVEGKKIPHDVYLKADNYVLVLKDHRGVETVRCATEAEVWDALRDTIPQGEYYLSSPTGKSLNKFLVIRNLNVQRAENGSAD